MPASRPRYAYLIDGRQAAGVAALWHLRDRGHRVSVLTKPTRIVLARSSRVYLPPSGPADSARRVVARYAPKDRLRLSGHLWPESQDRLPGAVFLYEERIGPGRVVAFAEDPSFRAYWRGSDRLFLNAVVLGPSAP